MSILSTLFSFTNNKKESAGIVSELGSVLDKFVTSDAERKEFQVKLERLSAINPNPLVAGGRSAIMYTISLTTLYYAVFRDMLAMIVGPEQVPPSSINISELLATLIKLLAGIL
ncbi:hypothetical protein L4174_023850 (plasmid) [Photobacterium sp. CCB-ST2H9]|uniref:hypothetical protein n=1 Tax=Photobacterium sp. CCB-ST2H9 TaxID=2912855 RepID=UPI0020039BC1|nr:hypothetical protein [Photobacterium sp. CCB-ST2H9]UTM60421.1 hypothetical protein L4174_023850 [Photobacterium sp. CCB-ST2H9]